MANGVKTSDLDPTYLAQSVIVNTEDGTAPQTVGDFAKQMARTDPLSKSVDGAKFEYETLDEMQATATSGGQNSGGQNKVHKTKDGRFKYSEDLSVPYLHLNGLGVSAVKDESGRIAARLFNFGEDATTLWPEFIGLLETREKHLFIDTDIHLPGVNSLGQLLSGAIQVGTTIEFAEGYAIIYDSDGSTDHPYLEITGATSLRLIRPFVRSTTAPTTRRARPGIKLIGCEDAQVYEPHILSTFGGGLMFSGCQNSRAYHGVARNTLADGFGIYNDLTYGPCVDVYTIGSRTINTGDDGVSVVGYTARGAANERCGHLDFTVVSSFERGGVLVGSIDSALRGRAFNCASSGFKVVKDLGGGPNNAPETHGNIRPHVEVISYNCAHSADPIQPSIDIGNNTESIVGSVSSYGGPDRGIQVAGDVTGPTDVDLQIFSQDAGGQGVYLGNVSGIRGNITSIGAGETGLVGLNCTGVAIGSVNLRDYNQDDSASHVGMRLNNVSGSIGPGYVGDNHASTLQPVDLLNCHGLRLSDALVTEGGSEPKKVLIQATCTDTLAPSVRASATWNPGSIAAGGYVTTTITVNGASPGDVLSVGFDQMQSGLTLTGFVSGANTTRLMLKNETVEAIHPAAGTVTVRAEKYLP